MDEQHNAHVVEWYAIKKTWMRGLRLRGKAIQNLKDDHLWPSYQRAANRVAKALGYTCYNALKNNQSFDPRINRCLVLLASPHGRTILRTLEEQNK